jgi:hypothetical protein
MCTENAAEFTSGCCIALMFVRIATVSWAARARGPSMTFIISGAFTDKARRSDRCSCQVAWPGLWVRR